jgi:hypothetical protein
MLAYRIPLGNRSSMSARFRVALCRAGWQDLLVVELELVREIAETFGLGIPRALESVTGGLSNDLWKVETGEGAFAVKVMRVNADSPAFRDNIESAYAIEAKAFPAGGFLS